MPLDTKYKITISFPEDFPKKLSAITEENDFYSEDDICNTVTDYIWILLEENGMIIEYEPVE